MSKTVADNHYTEAALLGAYLERPERVAPLCRAAGIIESFFELSDHRTVFGALSRAEPSEINTISILHFIRENNNGSAERIDMPFLDSLIDSCPTIEAAPQFIAMLVEKYRNRRLQTVLTDAKSKLESGEDASTLFDEIAELRRKTLELVQPVDAASWLQTPLPEPEQVLCDAFDLGTKCVLVGASKERKSFGMLQMGISLAAGLPKFLVWDIPQARRVLYWNLEITPGHFQKRLHNMLYALDVSRDALSDRLHVWNTRGHALPHFDNVAQVVRKNRIEVLLVDPVYKLIPGSESEQLEVKTLLRDFDRLCTETGAAIVYCHHAGKGISGDREAVDLASGSGVFARDFDCQISLRRHEQDGLVVMEQIARSYPPRDAFTAEWDDRGCFVVNHEIAPALRTSRNKDASGRVGKTLTSQDAFNIVQDKPLPSDLFHAELRQLGFTERAAREIKSRLLESQELLTFTTKTFPRKVYIGSPDAIRALSGQEKEKAS